MRDHEWSNRLLLNGDAIRLGTVSDVVDKVHGRRTLEVGLVDGEVDYHWSFSGERSEMSMSVDRVVVGGKTFEHFERLQYLLPPLFDNQLAVVVKSTNIHRAGISQLNLD